VIPFSSLSEHIPDDLKPPVDRIKPPSGMSDTQMAWRRHGYIILRDVIPHALCDAYLERRRREGQWPTPVPYMTVPEIRELCCHESVRNTLEHIFGEPMLMHLNLTNLTSTERDWHQDTYLNPPEVGGYYCAVWYALGDVSPDSGPFEFVAGSHRWPWLTRDKVLLHATKEERESDSWPSTTERFVVPAITEEIRRKKAPISKFFPARKGDILIWHAGLIHRGSPPNIPGMERPAIIAHFSAPSHRADMPNRDERGWFVL
jgi:ectoine hydroxylase-related dioxygenase (phytanoyl-CoA dioxygenase family)